ncbi:MAG TPA: arginyltransferase [Nevskiaceae bacterium]|nr:arginyltransferase [Nevskiaceae bacterium]
MSEPQRVRLYLSTGHACGYLSGLEARNAYLDPDFPMSPQRYGWLLAQGFRRSGVHVYRPHCPQCHACQPARVPVADFVPSRTQRRCLARNDDLQLTVTRELGEEHFELYQRYLAVRHPGGGMDSGNREAFHLFLECGWGDAQFWEFRVGARLLALAVVDRVPSALSAVYTFFDPDEGARSLGTLAVLRQIEAAAEQRLDHVYLGYWVRGSAKMDYKRNFRPLELLGTGGWHALES